MSYFHRNAPNPPQLPLRVGVDERALPGADRRRLLPLLLALPLHRLAQPGAGQDEGLGGRAHELRGYRLQPHGRQRHRQTPH